MQICQGVCNDSNKCKGTVKRIRVEGWSETFLYCDTAINLCKTIYKITILDCCDIDCETNCICDMNILMLRGCQCGGK